MYDKVKHPVKPHRWHFDHHRNIKRPGPPGEFRKIIVAGAGQYLQQHTKGTIFVSYNLG